MPKKFRVCLFAQKTAKISRKSQIAHQCPKSPCSCPTFPNMPEIHKCVSPIMPKCSADMFRTVLPGGVMGVVKLPNIAVICGECAFAYHAKK